MVYAALPLWQYFVRNTHIYFEVCSTNMWPFRYWRDLINPPLLISPLQAATSVFTLNVPRNRVMDSWIVESGILEGPDSFVGSATVTPLTNRKFCL